jgi:hypothetical protein
MARDPSFAGSVGYIWCCFHPDVSQFRVWVLSSWRSRQCVAEFDRQVDEVYAYHPDASGQGGSASSVGETSLGSADVVRDPGVEYEDSMLELLQQGLSTTELAAAVARLHGEGNAEVDLEDAQHANVPAHAAAQASSLVDRLPLLNSGQRHFYDQIAGWARELRLMTEESYSFQILSETT